MALIFEKRVYQQWLVGTVAGGDPRCGRQVTVQVDDVRASARNQKHF